MACTKGFKNQFNKKYLFFCHEPLEDFVRSQWQYKDTSVPWLVWRWFCALFFVVGMVFSMLQGWCNGVWFLYLTDWGFLIVTITHIYAAIMTTVYHCTLKTHKIATRIFWLLHHSAAVLALFISLLYWTMIFPGQMHTISNHVTWWTHFSNSVIMSTDILLVAYPIRLLHFVYPLIFALCYGLFLIVFYFAGWTDADGNPYVYEIIDWRTPKKALVMEILCMLSILIHAVIVQLLYVLRLYIYSKIRAGDKTKPPT